MSEFVIGLLVVQVLLGAYQFSYTANTGRPESSARATRLPSPVIFGHGLFAGVVVALWIGYLVSGNDVVPWITLGVLALSVLTGGFMLLRTVRGSDRTGGPSPDVADHVVAEKQIPGLVLALHGLFAVVLVVGVLLVALGVAD